jgi:hypothetical protein
MKEKKFPKNAKKSKKISIKDLQKLKGGIGCGEYPTEGSGNRGSIKTY